MDHHYFLIHKPYGYLSQFIHHHEKRKNKKMLGELFDFPVGTMAVGRLDEKSEGLLLLTTDGKFSHQIRAKDVEKEYYVQVDGVIDEQALEKLRSGVEISLGGGKKYLTLPSKTKSIEDPGFEARIRNIRYDSHGPTSWISIILTEGKFRQVRKMTAAVGYPTLRLVRVRIADWHLNDLSVGEVITIRPN